MEPTVDGDAVYWLEMRPEEGGRYVLVRRSPDGRLDDLTPAPFNARTRVHEYGGASYLVAGGVIFFSNFADQRLYRQDPGAAPSPLTPAVDMRYADGVADAGRNRIICVREDHTRAGQEAQNTVVAVDMSGGSLEDGGQVLASGHDFYAAPRLSPDGSQLAWVAWNHPNMPWDDTELWLADVTADGGVTNARRIAGGVDESVLQPHWSPDGVLYFISDRTGWWNIYRWRNGQVEAMHERAAEFAGPAWVFGNADYDFLSETSLICRFSENGRSQLARLDLQTGVLEPIDTPFTVIGYVHVQGSRVVFAGGAPDRATAVAGLDLDTGQIETLSKVEDSGIDPVYFTRPEPIEFPTTDGATAYAFYYPPHNPDHQAPADDRPPLLVISHGGPTGATTDAQDLRIQYWTSRGVAVVDVNYRGSTGYGRAYRQALYGRWGIVDVDDCIHAAQYLIGRDAVDANRVAIRGGSAGGYTTLAALTFRDFFKAGASYYGVSDLEALALETHKFESRYLDQLIGPYPEKKELYLERSPIHHVDRLACPVIFFQGLEDKVVPPNQAERMVDALRRKGIPVAYVPFEGEQHGFRRAENIARSLDGELYFYSRIFGFALAEPVEPVEIENLPAG
ncbi:MAG: S9 family peptidase [Caldilineae bacterium]|nr:MAG: S9 family peptidase [Caldilineae bacterium]